MLKQPFVLVIEDAEDIAVIYAEILQMHGMLVELILDGAVALERLATVTPDLILLDMNLPHVSGLELLASIRQDSRFATTKVVAITANAFLAQDLENSADLTLLKPVSVTQISDLSSRLLASVRPSGTTTLS